MIKVYSWVERWDWNKFYENSKTFAFWYDRGISRGVIEAYYAFPAFFWHRFACPIIACNLYLTICKGLRYTM